MISTEGLGDIVEYPTSELGDDIVFGDDDDFEEELNPKATTETSTRNYSSRPGTNKSTNSQLRGDSKRVRLKHSHPPVVNFVESNLKRDPNIEYIIEARKSNLIENSYTRLANATSQMSGPSYSRSDSMRPRFMTSRSDTQMQANSRKGEARDSAVDNKLPFLSIVQFETEMWDDGLTNEIEREENMAKNKSSLQLYEETCKRLNISMCSAVARRFFTTRINLANYGLGPKGAAALAVALLRNTTVRSLNLSNNNIGNAGMSYMYQVLTENTYIEDYDLSNNNLGGRGARKLAEAMTHCVQLRRLNIAGNGLNGSDVAVLLEQLEEHSNLQFLNLSYNQLDEDGGIALAKWLADNNVLLELVVSWCGIRLLGARALAKAIGDNNKLASLIASNNSFTNETVELLKESLMRNMVLNELDISGNEIFCTYNTYIKENPSVLINGSESFVYGLLAAAMTNQVLKIFRLGKNHLDTRCVLIILEALSQLDQISLEELDLTGLTLTLQQAAEIERFFANTPKFKCFVDPVKRTVEPFANHLMHAIRTYCAENELTLVDLFAPSEEDRMIISHDHFCESLRKVKIPIPVTQIEDIMKHLGREDEEGTISMRSLETY